jgi:hypothetical protein
MKLSKPSKKKQKKLASLFIILAVGALLLSSILPTLLYLLPR